MTILGIGGILNDAACAILKDGKLAAAVEEKKIARRSTSGELPEQSLAACLELAEVKAESVECVAVARPFADTPGASLHLQIRSQFPNSRLVVVEHHSAHAASAFYPSPFERATVLTLDRIGDLRCGAVWSGDGTRLSLEQELYYPDPLGDVYGRVTALLGFVPNADEHKVQWLSTSGDSRFVGLFEEILGTGQLPRIDRSYFDSDRSGRGEFSAKFYQQLGMEDGSAVPANLRAHVAAGLQRAVENTALRMAGD